MTAAHGLSVVNRERLETLHRRLKGPFSVSDAAAIWSLDATRARRLVAYLAARGWLSRVRRDSYTTVPLGATSPKQWREDPWVVAARTFAPCYLGGWTACEHWGLTEQIFREMIVFTTRRVRHRREEIQGTRFRIKVIAETRMFGLVDVWRAQNQVKLSDSAIASFVQWVNDGAPDPQDHPPKDSEATAADWASVFQARRSRVGKCGPQRATRSVDGG